MQRGEVWGEIIFYMILDIYTRNIYTSSFGFLLRKIEAWEKKGGREGSARHAATTASHSAAACKTLPVVME